MKIALFLNSLVLVLLASGCASAQSNLGVSVALNTSTTTATSIPERHRELAGRLQTAVEKASGELNYGSGFESASEIIPYLKINHSRLYAKFNKTVVKFKIDDGHVIGLLCDTKGRYAIAEDVSCTPKFDNPHGDKNTPCVFTLRAKDICDKHVVPNGKVKPYLHWDMNP